MQAGRERKRIVFAEGEEPSVIRAAYAFQSQGLGKAILVRPRGAGDVQHAPSACPPDAGLEIINARLSDQ